MPIRQLKNSKTSKVYALKTILKISREEHKTSNLAFELKSSAKILDLSRGDIFQLFYLMGYCDTRGDPYDPRIKRIWDDP